MIEFAERTPAVIVGAGVNGLGVLRSLARAGVSVILVDNNARQPGMRSRYGVKHLYQGKTSEALVDALEQLANGWEGQRAVLFITQEETVAALADKQTRLSRFYHLTMPGPQVIDRLLHKNGFRAAAELAGAHVPRTVHVQNTAQIESIAALSVPLIIKPAIRNRDYAQHFRKAYRIDTMEQARALLDRILPVLNDLIVQEWIEGTDSDLYFCLQYIPPSGAQPVSFVGRKIRSWPPQTGGTASCAPAPEAAELAHPTTVFFRSAGVTGLASMEYKRHAITGEYIMVEPTIGRTDYQEEIATLNGVNIPLAAYADLLGMSLGTPPTGRKKQNIWRDRLADKRSESLTAPEYTRLAVGARTIDALWRVSDPMPVLASLMARLKRRLRRLIGGYPRRKSRRR